MPLLLRGQGSLEHLQACFLGISTDITVHFRLPGLLWPHDCNRNKRIGRADSALSILIVQGTLTLMSGVVAPYTDQAMIDAVSAVGGLLIIMIGINLLELKKIKTANFTPALVLIILFQLASPWLSRFTG